MKIIRYTLYGLLALIALLVIGVTIFVYTFDPKQYKGDIERLVKEHTGRTLVLSDEIKMSVYPKLGVQVGPTSLTEADHKTTFVSVNSAQVSVALMPLLKRQVLVDGVNLDGLVANIVRNKDGRFNFDDLGNKAAKADPSDVVELSGDDGKETEIQFDVGGINLTDATISYLDQSTKQHIELRNFDLSTGQIAMQAKGDLKLSAQVQADFVPLNAKVGLTSEYVLDLPAQKLAFNQLAVTFDGKAADLASLQVNAKTSLTADLSKTRFDLQGVEVDASAKNLFKASVRSAALSYQPDALHASQVSVNANMDQPRQKLGVQVQAPEVSGKPDHIVIKRFDATVQADMPDVLKQALKIPLHGNLDLNLAKSTLQTTFDAKVDDSAVRASVSLPRMSPPAYRADISIDQINLDRYLAQSDSGQAKAADSKPAAKTDGTANAQSGPIDLSALRGLDVQAKIAIGALTLQGVKLDNLKTDVHASKGQLRVGPHSAKVSGGTLQGDLTVNANNNQFRISERLSKVSIGKLLEEMDQESRLEGQANLEFDLTTQGNDTSKLVQNLGGQGSFGVGEGAIRGVDIARLLRSIQGVITSGKLPTFSEDDKTVFSELNGTVKIQQGVVTNNDLNLKAPLFRLSGEGSANLVTTQVDYLARLAVVETTKGQEGPELEALRGVIVPVRVVGPFDNPKYQIDIASLAAQIAKTRAGQKVFDQVEKAVSPETTERVEKILGPDVTDKLKGLFGR